MEGNTSLRQLTDEAVALLKELIRTPRVSREEGAAADVLQRYMQEVCGLAVQRDGNNLWSVAPGYDASRPTLLLNAHIDTVRPVSGWTRQPYVPTLEGDRLYGLGSNDDGGSLVSLLMAFVNVVKVSKALSASKAPNALSTSCGSYNLIFLASAEEEVSGKNGIEHVLPLLPPIDVALVGEPTGMQPAVAEKGLMVLDCTAHGRAGHAARNEGDNAIYHAMDDMQWFRTHQWERISPLLGAVKMSVTIVNAGTQHNVVPDQCIFTVDVRSNELYSNKELYEEICQHVQCDVKARSFRLNSSQISLAHPLVQRILQASDKQPFGSPTLSDQALLSCPSLKMGPGDSRRSHTADEYICISEIEDAIGFYRKLLMGEFETQG